MPEAYIPVLLFVLVAIAVAVGILMFTSLIASSKYNKVRLQPY